MVAIFSDLHDNLKNLDLFLVKVKKAKAKALVFCGDLASSETLKYLAEKWPLPIHLVGGNADHFTLSEAQKIPHLKYQAEFLSFHLGNFKVLVAHKPADLKKILAEDTTYDFAFYGHTHTPWIKKEAGVTIANPGNLKDNLGQATYALWNEETGKLELKRIND